MTKSVLFVCNMNSVRSPMAAAILASQAQGALRVDSAGVYEGGLDPFVESVLGEIGMSLGDYEPKAVSDTTLDGFDLVIALTPEALVSTAGTAALGLQLNERASLSVGPLSSMVPNYAPEAGHGDIHERWRLDENDGSQVPGAAVGMTFKLN